MKTSTYIYALVDPIEKQEFHIYIGKSNNPYRRYLSHLSDETNTYKTNWIQSLLNLGLTPKQQILEQCDNIKVIWEEKERFFIAFYKKCGYTIYKKSKYGCGDIEVYYMEKLCEKNF